MYLEDKYYELFCDFEKHEQLLTEIMGKAPEVIKTIERVRQSTWDIYSPRYDFGMVLSIVRMDHMAILFQVVALNDKMNPIRFVEIPYGAFQDLDAEILAEHEYAKRLKGEEDRFDEFRDRFPQIKRGCSRRMDSK